MSLIDPVFDIRLAIQIRRRVRYVSDDDKPRQARELKNFGHKYVHIPEHFLRDFDRLLKGEIWANCERSPTPCVALPLC
jgi:hypothetical protein